jgi:hypothetical protein
MLVTGLGRPEIAARSHRGRIRMNRPGSSSVPVMRERGITNDASVDRTSDEALAGV